MPSGTIMYDTPNSLSPRTMTAGLQVGLFLTEIQVFSTTEITEFHGFQLFFEFGNVSILSFIKFRRKASIDFLAF